jgi:uncharacterized metal-binding protein YceD (DUF177 family)
MSKQDLTYQIQHSSLEKGQHSFDFKVGRALFDRFDNEELVNPDIHVHLELEKRNHEFIVDIKAEGTVELQCDRCLDYYTHEVDAAQRLVMKLAEATEFDLDEDFVTLDRDSNSVDFAYLIYETIVLGLPLKRVHPLDENGEYTCNPEVTKHITGESKLRPDEENNETGGTGDEDWKNDLRDLIN